MRRKYTYMAMTLLVILAFGSVAVAQIRTGAIEGKVTDDQGGVMPGVTVTLSGERVIGESVTITLDDGSYRFRALEAGTYNLLFELVGFARFNREGILIAGARTITVDVTMQVAAVAETIPVTGESPLIDVKQTVIGATFDDELKQDIPGSTDTWALLGQTPGVRMRGFDVGGSHKSQQSGFEAYGIRDQEQVSVDGLITTESTGGTTWYFDYYATEEVRISASSGADAEMETAGAAYVTTIKSGGDNFSSLVNYDFLKEGMVGSNLDEATVAQGYTGNQTLDFWEFHGDIGGPIVREKAWFYFAHNRFRVDTSISGQDPEEGTDLARIFQFNFKATWQFTEQDKLIYFMLRNDKDKPQRYLSSTRPLESTAHNINPGYGYKGEWQRVWSDRFFTSVLFGYMDDDWWNVPNVDPVARPPREDYDTGMISGAYMYPFVTLWRDPSVVVNSNYYVSEAAGSHDIKIGGMWRYENHFDAETAQAGPVYYFDEGGVPLELELADYADEVEKAKLTTNNNKRWGFWIQDNWTPLPRLTLNLGMRYLSQHSFYGSARKDNQALTAPEWYPWLEGLFSTAPVPGADVGTWSALAPRLGATYDLSGEGRTVLKASYGRYYNNFSYGLASSANPGYSNGAGFEWQDIDGNGILTREESIGRQELGEMIYDWGGGSTVIDTNAPLPHSDQYQISLEHQFRGETAMRIMYVRKTQENLGLAGETVNLAQVPFLTVPFQAEDPGAPGQMLNLLTTPADRFGTNNVITEYPDSNSWAYDTITVGLERRFAENFFAQGSFDYQWREEARTADSISSSPLTADPIGADWYQNHSADVDTIQESTNWGFKVLARYQLPAEIGIATNIRVQSGWPYARRADITIYAGTGVESPGAESLGSQPVFVEDIKNNRSETVPLWDFRIDKTFSLGDAGRFMVMIDIYNILNSNAVTNINLRTGSFGNVIAALPPRTLKIGLRWTY